MVASGSTDGWSYSARSAPEAFAKLESTSRRQPGEAARQVRPLDRRFAFGRWRGQDPLEVATRLVEDRRDDLAGCGLPDPFTADERRIQAKGQCADLVPRLDDPGYHPLLGDPQQVALHEDLDVVIQPRLGHLEAGCQLLDRPRHVRPGDHRLEDPEAERIGQGLEASTLSYQEPGAPRYVWLVLLMPLALLRVVPAGWAQRLVIAWKWLAIAALVLLLVPFLARQVQQALYPQLEVVGAVTGEPRSASRRDTYGIGDGDASETPFGGVSGSPREIGAVLAVWSSPRSRIAI